MFRHLLQIEAFVDVFHWVVKLWINLWCTICKREIAKKCPKKNSSKTLFKLVRLEICPWQLQIWRRPDAVGLLRTFCPNFCQIFDLLFEVNRSSEFRKPDRLRCRWWFRPIHQWDGERSRRLWKIRKEHLLEKQHHSKIWLIYSILIYKLVFYT